MFPCRSLVGSVETKLANMSKSAQFQTPVQSIHFIDLTVDSLGCFSKNIGSRQHKNSQWICLFTYHLGTTTVTDFRNFILDRMTNKDHFDKSVFLFYWPILLHLYGFSYRLSRFDRLVSLLAQCFGKSSSDFHMSIILLNS